VIHASTNPTSFPSRSLLLHAGLSLNKATQYGDFRTYHRIGGHCDNGGRDCAWGVCCCCSTLHTDRHCTESRLGRLDHMCWLRESRDLTLKHLDWQLTLPRSSASRTQSQPPKDVGPNLLNLLQLSLTLVTVEYGMGQHYWDLSQETKTSSFYWFWISIWVYYAGLFFVKISILLQYLRVFVQKNFQIACYVLIGLVTACSLWAILSGIFMCTPVSHFWKSSVQGECMNRLGVWYSAAGVNAATDFATAILPLPLVSTLPISRQQKILLMIVFGFGFW
jgi:hypothetical protein